MTLLYMKGEDNLVADALSWILTAHHYHKLENTTLEEDTCEILCLDSLLISDSADCLSLDIENISFPLAPHIMEAEKNMELQTESSTNTWTDPNNANYNCKYNPVKGINCVHYRDRIYAPKTLRKCVLNGIMTISNIKVVIDLHVN